jgi:hypothetical protein
MILLNVRTEQNIIKSSPSAKVIMNGGAARWVARIFEASRELCNLFVSQEERDCGAARNAKRSARATKADYATYTPATMRASERTKVRV